MTNNIPPILVVKIKNKKKNSPSPSKKKLKYLINKSFAPKIFTCVIE